MGTPIPTRVIKKRNVTKLFYSVSSLVEGGFTMNVQGLKDLGILLKVLAVNGSAVRVSILSRKEGDSL